MKGIRLRNILFVAGYRILAVGAIFAFILPGIGCRGHDLAHGHGISPSLESEAPSEKRSGEPACDILVVGGSDGGTAAALAAAEAGAGVCLMEDSNWLGGQLTSQGVSVPDEPKTIRQFGGTRRYYRFLQLTRDYYFDHYRVKPGMNRTRFNPGSCIASYHSFEPRVGARVLRALAQPLIDAGRLHIFYNTHATACEMDAAGTTIRSVTAVSNGGAIHSFHPRYVLDSTDLGDLLAIVGAEGSDWISGAESRADTGEPDAPAIRHPEWVQPFTFPFALSWSPSTAAANRIPEPQGYAELKTQQKYTAKDGYLTGVRAGPLPWWRYRRILCAGNFQDPRISQDITLVNCDSNDYLGGDTAFTLHAARPERDAFFERARRVSLGYLYWLQNECPRDGGRGKGYPEFRLRKDVFSTPDGLAKSPYIRESRRIRAVRTVKEQDISVRANPGARAKPMSDSVGIGHYALDIHRNGGGEKALSVKTRPFQVPLGALIPIRLENLIPAGKAIGATHLTNGAYRLHSTEWNIGESAGLLAAFCLRIGVTPRQLATDTHARKRFQEELLSNGIPLYWVIDVPIESSGFPAVQRLAMTGVLRRTPDLLFHPERAITSEVWRAWKKAMGRERPAEYRGSRLAAAMALVTDAPLHGRERPESRPFPALP